MMKKMMSLVLAAMMLFAVTTSAFAWVLFTPSVAGKPAPSLISGTSIELAGLTPEELAAKLATMTEEEKAAAGFPVIAVDGEANVPHVVVLAITNPEDLIVTPVSARASMADAEARARLENAYTAIQNAAAVADLPAKSGDNLGAEIDTVLVGTGLTSEDLVIRDLFDLSLYNKPLEAFVPENHLEVSFAADTDALVVLVSADGNTWEVMPAEQVVINGGVAKLHMDTIGAVAFLVNSATVGGDVVSPATGD